MEYKNTNNHVEFFNIDNIWHNVLPGEILVTEIPNIHLRREGMILLSAEESKPEPEPEAEKKDIWDTEEYKELKELVKDEQVTLIKELDEDAKIPRYEHDRIMLILKLREG